MTDLDRFEPEPDRFDLERFVTAQNRASTYAHALDELRRGRKSSHWMWFVFPQLAGLGQSPTSRHFAVRGLPEAGAYLDHPLLGARLRECADALTPHTDRSASEIFGSIDAQKLRSSMTLFRRAAPQERRFGAVLDRFFGGETDPLTDRLLARRG